MQRDLRGFGGLSNRGRATAAANDARNNLITMGSVRRSYLLENSKVTHSIASVGLAVLSVE